ncbi:MAG TPA: hypothetical protein VMZ03_11285 [Chitinophagaceae bacterium]|nr:hypothetical protein [Chitinophagaceae bacterium]
MTHRKYFSIAFILIYVLFSLAAKANTNSKDNSETQSVKTEKSSEPAQGKHSPLTQEEHSKVPHGKTHTPHSEELPHIHKFHKDRVKKIKKHHSKYWLLSQAILFLCHAAILYISYLHAAH